MKTLIFGTLAFLVWSSFSTHHYVCKIKNLCLEPIALAKPIDKEPLAEVENEIEDDVASPKSEEITSTIDNPGTFTIHHIFNSVAFDPSPALDDYIQTLKEYAQQSGATIKLIGFTDSTGNADYNLKLGKERAATVKKYLVEKGVDTNLITIETRGENNPETTNATNEGRAINRRTEILMQE